VEAVGECTTGDGESSTSEVEGVLMGKGELRVELRVLAGLRVGDVRD
jgi:hypothetical protein